MRYILILMTCFLLMVPAVQAQDGSEDDGGGFLTRTIEGALSGAGRKVNIVGFAGALSSEATFERMTIADEQGIWLTLEDVALNWRRTALLRGRLEVNSLTASSLEITRLPEAQEEPLEVPAAEAEEFSLKLPELPVSINVAAFEVSTIDLGEPIIGVAAKLALNASARLDDEGLFLDLTANRIDEVAGVLGIKANVLRDGAEIDLNLSLQEAPGGIAARLLNLPDLPSVDLSIVGLGPLDNFTADINLATAEQPRLAGQVILSSEQGEGSDTGPNRRIRADLGGDITALIAPEYESFFGPNVGLTLNTVLAADGAVDVQDFTLKADAVDLAGTVRLNADKWPSFVDVKGEISQDGDPVVLPGSDAELTVTAVTLDVSFDAAQGDTLTGMFDIADIVLPTAQVDRVVLELDGVLDGTVDAIGKFATDVELTASGLKLEDPDTDEALGETIRAVATINYVEDEPIEISGLSVRGTDYSLNGEAVIAGLGNGFPTDLRIEASAADLSRFAGLAGQPLAGAVELAVQGSVTPLSTMFDLDIVGSTQDVAVDIPQADALLTGRTELSLNAVRDVNGTFVRDLELNNDALDVTADAELRSGASTVDARIALTDIALVLPEYQGAVLLEASAGQTEEGWWRVDTVLDAPYDSRAIVSGLATGPDADLMFDLSVPDVKPVIPEAEGSLSAKGRLWQSEKGYKVDVKADGPFDAALTVIGLATGPEADLNFDLSVPEVQPIIPNAQGPLSAKGRLWQSEEGYRVDVKAGGPFDATVEVIGLATGPDADLNFDLLVPEVRPIIPNASGPLSAEGRLWQTEQGYQIDVTAGGPFDATVDVAGLATGPDAKVDVAANLPDMGVFIPELAGALALTGEIARAGENWAIDTNLKGPAGMVADAAGTAASDGSTVDITIAGMVPLGLAGPFVAPSSLTGPVTFDLALKGPPSLDALSGQITSSGVSFSDPNTRVAIDNIKSRIDLAKSAAQFDVGANIVTGGRLEVGGNVDLTSLNGDISIAMINALFIDPNLYAAQLDGNITVKGALTGGARIAGRIDLAEVNVTVPGTGVTSIGVIPEITHVGASQKITTTQSRAGVLPKETKGEPSANRPAFLLSVDINAPSKIFIRGRGLNAELGGDLQVRGDTNTIVTSGGFDLIRGRLDIIGKRFDLDEGSIQFQGSVTPYIRFVTTTEVPDGTASIVVEGLATEPDITFSAVPEAPEDQVLSLIIFGRYTSELSAFQALELANGISQISGRGGVNVVGNLRDEIGLDELDVTTGEDGETSITAGKYITDDIYTDVTTNSEKGTDISLNIDLTDDLKGRATVAEDGDSSVGLFFERDY